MIKEGATYYRFTKDEGGGGTGCSDIIQEKSSSLTAVDQPGQPGVDLHAGLHRRGAGTSAVEGPSVFKANPGDTSPYDYYLFVDEYGGRGYIPLGADDLDNATWRVPAAYNLPASPRHGTVIPVTQAELDALRVGTETPDPVESDANGLVARLPADRRRRGRLRPRLRRHASTAGRRSADGALTLGRHRRLREAAGQPDDRARRGHRLQPGLGRQQPEPAATSSGASATPGPTAPATATCSPPATDLPGRHRHRQLDHRAGHVVRLGARPRGVEDRHLHPGRLPAPSVLYLDGVEVGQQDRRHRRARATSAAASPRPTTSASRPTPATGSSRARCATSGSTTGRCRRPRSRTCPTTATGDPRRHAGQPQDHGADRRHRRHGHPAGRARHGPHHPRPDVRRGLRLDGVAERSRTTTPRR